MKNLNMFCLSMNPNHHKAIQELNYIPVGLGRENFSNNFRFPNKTPVPVGAKSL